MENYEWYFKYAKTLIFIFIQINEDFKEIQDFFLNFI